jgi:predicted RecB family nuclease
MDMFGDPSKRDEISAFVQLLWDRGHAFEQEVIQGLSIPFTDLSGLSGKAKDAATQEAMARGDELIYQGRICARDLLGEPDLMRKQGNAYVAGDIKSGAGLEGSSGDTDGRPKKHYAVQLSLYTDILERLGHNPGRTAFVWDIHGHEVLYDLNAPQGVQNPQALWNYYGLILQDARDIVSQADVTRPAMASGCKLCHWRPACKQQVKKAGDLTLIPELGRSKRDVLASRIPTINAMAKVDVTSFVQPCIIYYYSKYERTWWRKLRAMYPHVATEQQIEDMFDPGVCIDLYGDVVCGHIEWPTNDYSIKTLAKYLGFNWRATEPSGAASIEWYHTWVESGDPQIRQRILDYNEDDCVAMRVLLDGIRELT